MQFRILGPLQVLDDGRELRLGPSKEQAVLGVLLLRSGSVVSRTQLIDGLWGERPPPTAAKAVNVYVSQVRKTLSVNGVDPIVTRAPGYVLDVDEDDLDSARFQRLATAARQREAAGEVEAAAALMKEALGLWRGSALAGLELEGEGRDDVARLEELRLAAQLDLIDYELALGRHEQLLAELEPLVTQHPLDERLRGQLILALYRSGRQAEALQAYRQTRDTLVETLGIEPSAPLQRLERAILNHDPSLEAPEGTARAGVTRRHSRMTRRGRRVAAVATVGAAVLCATAGYLLIARPSGQWRLAASSVGIVDGDRAEGLLTLPESSDPVGLAADADSLWLTTSAGELVRADPAHSGRASSFETGGDPGPITVADGSVWAVDSDRGVVDQIDSATVRRLRTIRVGNGPSAIALGTGALWITNELDGTLSRIDLTDASVTTFPVGQAPDGVTVGGGSVWVSDAAGGYVWRIDPANNQIVGRTPVGSAPGALAFGSGSVWVANRDDGTVSRISPGSGKVLVTIPVGRSADGVAFAEGSVWAISSTDGRLSRIDPSSNSVVRWSNLGSSPTVVASNGRRLVVGTVAAPPTGHRGGTLRLVGGGAADSATLDPATWWTTTGWSLLAVTNDGLLTIRRSPGPSGLQIVPDLARSAPVVAQGGRSYTFQLRPGIHYSNGQLVRARDVRASIERLWKIGSFATTVGGLRLGLVGEAKCAQAPKRCDLRRGIVVDDSTGVVTFRLTRANPQFERLLTLPFYDLLPDGTPPRDGRPLPATGPYRIVRFERGRLVEAERNPQFRSWSTVAQPPGYPDRIRWRLSQDDKHAIRSVRSGRSDFAVLADPNVKVPAVAPAGKARVENQPFPALVYAFLNTRVTPFDHVAVRRALNLAVDRRIVVQHAGGTLFARPTCQILPPSFPGYRPWCPYTFGPNQSGTWIAPDLAAARALVARSGTGGTKIVVWTMRDPDRPERFKIGRYLTDVLRGLGYRATLHTAADADSFYPYVNDSRHRVQIGVLAWVPDLPNSSSSFFEPVLTCNSYQPGSSTNSNLSGFCDPRTDALIRHAVQLEQTNAAAASALWTKIDSRIAAAAPWVPLYNVRMSDVLSTRVGNYQHNPMLGFLLDQAWVN